MQFQMRLHPRIKSTLGILCARSKRSMSALCLYLLERSFSGVNVKNASGHLEKAVRLSKPNTLRLTQTLHLSIGLAAAAHNRSMNLEINSRVYDQAVDMLASSRYNLREGESEWMILQHLSESQGEALRRRATARSMDVFEYSATLLAGILDGESGK